MYEAFYGLKERPFNLTPDPKYLYLSDKHKEAFAHLLFGIKNRSGFVMVTGEIGTGKTTICRNLINQLNQDVNLALIFNPSLNPVELMQKINAEFGIPCDATNVRELVDQLNGFLLEQAVHDKTNVLIIDEAQNLSPSVLEQIRLLSNLETETEKLLQIILIGQPELAEKLALYELRQLNQRITARYHLKPLDQKETQLYIQYRLHVAGGRRKLKFTPAATRTVYRHSKGTPRVINAVSDRSLLIGYTKETHVITPRIARQAIRELRGTYRDTARDLRRMLASVLPSAPTLVLSGAVLAVLLGLGAYFAQPIRQLAQELGAFNRIVTNAQPPADAAAPAPSSTQADAAAASPAPPAQVPVSTQLSPTMNAVIDTMVRNNPPAPAGPPPLAESIAQLQPDAALQAGVAALLAAWNTPLTGEYPARADLRVLRDFAKRHNLSVEYIKPALDQLLAINLPALVKVGHLGDGMWVSLIAGANGKLSLTGKMGERIETTREAFATMYAKEAYVFWNDATPSAPDLIRGRQGKPVVALKEKLRQLGRIDSKNVSDEFDVETATAISQIQSESGLVLDGIVGEQVRMVMASWLGGAETPKLDPNYRTGKRDQAAAVEAPAPVPVPVATPVEQPKAAPAPVEDENPLPTSIPAPQPQPVPKPVAQPEPRPVPKAEAKPEPTPAPEVKPAPEPAPVPVEATPEAAAPLAADISAPPAEESPASTEADGGVVQVQNLPEPVEGSFVPEADDARKETTPPVNGSAPLVPAE